MTTTGRTSEPDTPPRVRPMRSSFRRTASGGRSPWTSATRGGTGRQSSPRSSGCTRSAIQGCGCFTATRSTTGTTAPSRTPGERLTERIHRARWEAGRGGWRSTAAPPGFLTQRSGLRGENRGLSLVFQAARDRVDGAVNLGSGVVVVGAEPQAGAIGTLADRADDPLFLEEE